MLGLRENFHFCPPEYQRQLSGAARRISGLWELGCFPPTNFMGPRELAIEGGGVGGGGVGGGGGGGDRTKSGVCDGHSKPIITATVGTPVSHPVSARTPGRSGRSARKSPTSIPCVEQVTDTEATVLRSGVVSLENVFPGFPSRQSREFVSTLVYPRESMGY